MGNNKKYITLIIFLISIIYCFSASSKNNELNHSVNNIYDPLGKDYTELIEDEYISNNIVDSTLTFYKFNILNDTDDIYIEFQSEYGCLYINAVKNISINSDSYHFEFCSEGEENNLFILSKSKILEKIEDNEKDSIANTSLIIGVGHSSLEESDLKFNYILKLSLRKSDINIFTINSDNKILCKMEKINEDNYRCLFMILNNFVEDNRNLIIYATSKNHIEKLNIYADYINNTEYNDWNVEYLSDNIPNIKSTYNNIDKDMNYIIIPKVEKNKYIFLSIESDTETNIEVLNKKITENSELPKVNEIYIYSVNNTDEMYIYLDQSPFREFTLYLQTIHGKANITYIFENQVQYIMDEINNKLILDINLSRNYFKLTINRLEKVDEFIFALYYKEKSNNILRQLDYGKSNKFLYNIVENYLFIYQQIQNIDSPANINLQIYSPTDKIYIDEFDVEIRILSKNDLYRLKLDKNQLNNFEIQEKGKFDSVFSASNIFLNIKDIENIDEIEKPYILICVKSNVASNNLEQLTIGSTISQPNGLIHSSERIYHYGKLFDEEKAVYRLKGNSNFRLMRLEFGCNNHYLGWSVKRINDNINYKKNDTDLSFVTEKWINGRQLLTMFIERGEDIYLTIFPKNKVDNTNITNYIFKYINSANNGDFKNYYIKQDSLNYNKKQNTISINKLKNIPEYYSVKYYLKIIKEEEYIKQEIISTIALTESNSILCFQSEDDDKIIFNLNKLIATDVYYYINAYSIVSDNAYDEEYISYSNIKINKVSITVIKANFSLIISSFSIAGGVLILLFIRWICYCCKKRRVNTYNYDYNYHYDNLLY